MPNCTLCGKSMTEGFCIENGIEYFHNACLPQVMSNEDYLVLYDGGKGDSYWSTWEEEGS